MQRYRHLDGDAAAVRNQRYKMRTAQSSCYQHQLWSTRKQPISSNRSSSTIATTLLKRLGLVVLTLQLALVFLPDPSVWETQDYVRRATTSIDYTSLEASSSSSSDAHHDGVYRSSDTVIVAVSIPLFAAARSQNVDDDVIVNYQLPPLNVSRSDIDEPDYNGLIIEIYGKQLHQQEHEFDDINMASSYQRRIRPNDYDLYNEERQDMLNRTDKAHSRYVYKDEYVSSKRSQNQISLCEPTQISWLYFPTCNRFHELSYDRSPQTQHVQPYNVTWAGHGYFRASLVV